MLADSPDLAAAKRLLDTAKRQGFIFQRVAPGPERPSVGRSGKPRLSGHHLPRRVRFRVALPPGPANHL